MRDPLLDHVAERAEPAPSGGKIERHVEQIAALPIALGIAVIEHVDLAHNRQTEHGNEWRGGPGAFSCDLLLVSRNQRAVMHGEALGPEEQFCRAQHKDVLATVEQVAQDHMYELVDEQRRCLAHAATHEVEIGGLHGLMADQMVAKRDHQGPILARVDIDDRRDLGGGDRAAWIAEHRRVQGTLGHTCTLRRCKLGPREIGLEELIRNQEAAAVIAVEQVMAAGEPEIGHAIVASTTYCWPSIPQHGNRDGVRLCWLHGVGASWGRQRDSSAPQPWPLALRSRRAPAHRHSLIPASPFISWCRLRPAASPTCSAARSANGYRRLGASRSSSKTSRAAAPARWAPNMWHGPPPTATRSWSPPTRPSSRHLTSTANCPMIRSTILSPSRVSASARRRWSCTHRCRCGRPVTS